jgi:hypothetical protein
MASHRDDSVGYAIGEVEHIAKLFRKRQKRAQNQISEGLRKWNDDTAAHWNQAATDLEKLARRLRKEFGIRARP